MARPQYIKWANVDPDLCRHMAPLGRNELTFPVYVVEVLRRTQRYIFVAKPLLVIEMSKSLCQLEIIWTGSVEYGCTKY